MAQVSFLWTGNSRLYIELYRIFSAYRPYYIFRSIDRFFNFYIPDLICTVYLYLFSSSYFFALENFHQFAGHIQNTKKIRSLTKYRKNPVKLKTKVERGKPGGEVKDSNPGENKKNFSPHHFFIWNIKCNT